MWQDSRRRHTKWISLFLGRFRIFSDLCSEQSGQRRNCTRNIRPTARQSCDDRTVHGRLQLQRKLFRACEYDHHTRSHPHATSGKREDCRIGIECEHHSDNRYFQCRISSRKRRGILFSWDSDCVCDGFAIRIWHRKSSNRTVSDRAVQRENFDFSPSPWLEHRNCAVWRRYQLRGLELCATDNHRRARFQSSSEVVVDYHSSGSERYHNPDHHRQNCL
jgi:hypothetical protein